MHVARGPVRLSDPAVRRAAATKAPAIQMLLAAAGRACRACKAAAVIALSLPVTARASSHMAVPHASCMLLRRSLCQVYAVGGGRSATVAAGIVAGRRCVSPIPARAPSN